jgi:hypothetical protein
MDGSTSFVTTSNVPGGAKTGCGKIRDRAGKTHSGAKESAEKLVFRVGRGFIPGINLVIFVAFRP